MLRRGKTSLLFGVETGMASRSSPPPRKAGFSMKRRGVGDARSVSLLLVAVLTGNEAGGLCRKV